MDRAENEIRQCFSPMYLDRHEQNFKQTPNFDDYSKKTFTNKKGKKTVKKNYMKQIQKNNINKDLNINLKAVEKERDF